MVDVTILGAGILGLSTAWACMARGARVKVIDPNGVAAGASGGILGALAPHTPENWNDKKGVSARQPADGRGFLARRGAGGWR